MAFAREGDSGRVWRDERVWAPLAGELEAFGESAGADADGALVEPADARDEPSFVAWVLRVEDVTSGFRDDAAHPISDKTRKPRARFVAACMVHPPSNIRTARLFFTLVD
jgi:hypothetical protein